MQRSKSPRAQASYRLCMYHTILSAKDRKKNSVAMATETGSMLDDVTKMEHVRSRQ